MGTMHRKKRTMTESVLAIRKGIDPGDQKQFEQATTTLNWLIETLLDETDKEVNQNTERYFVLDFSMIQEVLEADTRAYGSIMAAGLSLSAKGTGSKAVVTEGTRSELLSYLRYSINQIAGKAKHLACDLTTGAFEAVAWQEVGAYARFLQKYDRKFVVLEWILSNCCIPFSALGIGEEEDVSEPELKETYEKSLSRWSYQHPERGSRTVEADKVDAKTLATIESVAIRQPRSFELRLVTVTRAIEDITRGNARVSPVHPMYFFLSQKARDTYRNPAHRLDFCYDCLSEILRLLKGINLIRHGPEMNAKIATWQIQQMVENWKSLCSEGAIGEVKRWIGRAVSLSANQWLLQPERVRETTSCCMPWTLVEHVIGKARRILSLLLGEATDVLQVLGACWSKREEFCDGTRDTLLFQHSNAKIVLERFTEYYSVHWDADCTIDHFISIVKGCVSDELLSPLAMKVFCRDGTQITRTLERPPSMSFIRESLHGQVLAMLLIEGKFARVYYEICPMSSQVTPELALRLLNSVRESRIAVVSCQRAPTLVATMCERTSKGYVTNDDFMQLFGAKIARVFE